jgi:pyruvate dehydrogenase E1 component alpha subunit
VTTVATFEIGFSRYLDQDGKPCTPLPDFAADAAFLRSLYRDMALARAFDAKAIALQRTGRLGTFASCLGQEAVGVAAAAAMRPDDVLLPSFREHGAMLARGVTLLEAFLFWGGDERGCDYSGPRQDFPISVPVGSHAAHAAGVALAMKLRGQARAAVCILGDGATSKGDVYEAMNVAGAWTLPVLFVVSNNQWAISLARDGQTAAETLAQKAIATGFAGEQVDGNDVIAVHAACLAALEKARRGGGPHLIEAITYRLSDHTTADDASRYRNDDAVSPHWAADPIPRLRSYLTAAHGWSKQDEETLIGECRALVDEAAESYLEVSPLPPEAMFDNLYAELPKPIAAQRAAVASGRGHGGGKETDA